MFDINILIICITVVICAILASAVLFAAIDKHAETRRPRTLAELLGASSTSDGCTKEVREDGK